MTSQRGFRGGLGLAMLVLALPGCGDDPVGTNESAPPPSPHISYLDFTNDNLKYAAKTGGTWTVETVDAAGDVGTYTSLALDRNSAPRISYFDVTNGDLKYAAKTSSTWTVETVDATGIVGGSTSLVVR